jgi:cytochrome c-type biogenesis protein CcmH
VDRAAAAAGVGRLHHVAQLQEAAALSGWVALAAIGLAAFAALRLIGVPRVYGLAAAAALTLGAAGYAVQQRAGLPGRPAATQAQAIEVDPGMVAFRGMIMPGTPGDRAVLATADANVRAGDTTAAVAGLLEAIRAAPAHAALWTGLGGALAAHDGGQVSPAARFAFRRATELAPREPGPPFFFGMAMAQSGDLDAARTAWLRALSLTPRDAPYRTDIAERLVIIDQFQAQFPAASGAAPPAP